MRKMLLIALMGLMAGLGQAFGGGQPAVREFKLSNGMAVWVSEDHTQPTVFGAVVVKAGANQCPGTGIAHYFEHLMFKGTDKIGTTDYAAEKPWLDSIAACYDRLAQTPDDAGRRGLQHEINRLSRKAAEYVIPNEFNNLISFYGGTGLNAATSYEFTMYYNAFAPEFIGQWAELCSERMLNPVFRMFQSELETVYEEKNMASDNMLAPAFENLLAATLEGTPYASPILGSTESLKNPSLSAMKEFFDTYYVAGNMGLILCGDVRTDSLMPLLERSFGRLRAGEAPARGGYSVKPFDGSRTVRIKLPIPILKVTALAYHTPDETDADYPAFNIAMQLLSNSYGSGLIDSLVDAKDILFGLAIPVPLKSAGFTMIGAVPRIPFGTKKKAERLCLEQIDRIKRGEFSDAMLETLKLSEELRFKLANEDIGQRAMQMIDAFASGNMTWNDYVERRLSVKSLTKDDIVAVANKYLDGNYMRVVKAFGSYPKDRLSQPGYSPVTPDNVDAQSEYARRLTAGAPGELQPTFVDFDTCAVRVALSPLATLYTVGNGVNDVFSIDFVFAKGTLDDPLVGPVSEYVGTLGTDSLTRFGLSMALANLGSEMSFASSRDAFTISLRGFDRNFEPTMRLFGHFISRVKGDKDKMSALVSGKKIEAKAFAKDYPAMASAMLNRVAYGENSPSLNVVSARKLAKVGPDGLLGKFKELLHTECMILYCGSAPDDSVALMVRRNLDVDGINIPHRCVRRPLLAYDKPVIYVCKATGARQTQVGTYSALPPASTVGQRAIQQLWAEYFGGSMSSVLFQEMREFRSLAYSSSGRLIQPLLTRFAGAPTAFFTVTSTQADKAVTAVATLDSLFSDMPERATGCEVARRALLNSINNGHPSLRNVAAYIARRRLEGYDSDPDIERASHLKSAVASDVWAYYAGSVKPAVRVFFVVGNLSKSDLRALGRYGEVVELGKADISGLFAR